MLKIYEKHFVIVKIYITTSIYQNFNYNKMFFKNFLAKTKILYSIDINIKANLNIYKY